MTRRHGDTATRGLPPSPRPPLPASSSPPTWKGLALLDRFLRQEFARRLVPRYTTLTRQLKQAWRQGGAPAVDRVLQAALSTLQPTLDTLILDGLTLAVQLAARAFAHEVAQQQYPLAQLRSLTAAAEDEAFDQALGMLLWPQSIQDLNLGKGAPADVLEQFQAMPDRWGYTYSQRIWKNDAATRAELQRAIQEHLSSGNSVLQDAAALTRFQIRDTTLPRYLDRLTQRAREVLHGSPEAKAAFLQAVKQAKTQIQSLKSGQLGTQGLSKRLVQQLTTAVKKGQEALLDQAVDTYIDKRAKYRATVLLRSEGVRAYQLASWEQYKKQRFVKAIKWQLSLMHKHVDECDFKAEADIGLGPGVYFKDDLPWPDHPSGLCHLSPVLVEPEDLGTAQPEVPSDPAAYQQTIEHLRGPLAKEATRLGRLKPTPQTKQAFTDLLKSVQKIAPAPPVPVHPPLTLTPPPLDVPPSALRLTPDVGEIRPSTPQLALPLERPPTVADVSQRDLPWPAALQTEAPPLLADSMVRQEVLERLGGSTGAVKVRGTDGVLRVAKHPPEALQSYVEATVNRLYRELGLAAPESVLTTEGGTVNGVANTFLDGKLLRDARLTKARAQQILDGFATDVWTMNWDAVGLELDNMLVSGKTLVRIDNGGSLIFRAQGGRKPETLWQSLSDWEGLANARVNASYAKVFERAGVSSADALGERAAKQIDAILDLRARSRQFADLLPSAPGISQADRELVLKVLRDRANLLEHEILPRLRPGLSMPSQPSVPALVSAQEQALIAEARQNGYALVRDTDEIEDQAVLFWHERDTAQNLYTRATLKVRGNSRDTLMQSLGTTAQPTATFIGPAGLELDTLNTKLIEAVKSAAYNVQHGGQLTPGLLQKIHEADQAFTTWKAALLSHPEMVEAEAILKGLEGPAHQWLQALAQAEMSTTVGNTGLTWTPPLSLFEKLDHPFMHLKPPAVPTGPGTLQWRKVHGVFDAADIQKGFTTVTNKPAFIWQEYYEAEIQGVRVRYWADTPETSFALRNRLEVRALGQDVASTEQALETLKTLGINITRPSALDAEELYLRQIAYHRKTDWSDFQQLAGRYTEQDKRVAAMRQWMSDAVGVPDITATPLYNPKGVRQAFGHGWRHLEQPDMVGQDWDALFKTTRLYHENTNSGSLIDVLDRILNSGGQMAPTVDKLRRGLPPGGWSPQRDLDTGGANYVFTRLVSYQTRKPGFYWKSTNLRRLDSISYQDDLFGRTTGDTVLRERQSTLTAYQRLPGYTKNETIFKNSLSIFDALDKIVFSSTWERDQAIALFERHGIFEWPDGRKLTSVLKAYK